MISVYIKMCYKTCELSYLKEIWHLWDASLGVLRDRVVQEEEKVEGEGSQVPQRVETYQGVEGEGEDGVEAPGAAWVVEGNYQEWVGGIEDLQVQSTRLEENGVGISGADRVAEGIYREWMGEIAVFQVQRTHLEVVAEAVGE